MVEVSCCAYELRLGTVDFVHGGRRFLIVRDCGWGCLELEDWKMQYKTTFWLPSGLCRI